MNALSSDPVREYYDSNTSFFLRLGRGGKTGSIHRQIWAPDVKTPAEASLYLNRLIADALRIQASRGGTSYHAIDLGCGVGGSITWVAKELGIRITGITNSPVQAGIAAQRIHQFGLEQTCKILLGDYLALPPLEPAQAAWAIESFVHASNPAVFFAEIAARIEAGGRLILCDDFLALPHPETYTQPDSRTWIERFQRGWNAPNLLLPDRTAAIASEHGWDILYSMDLTTWLRGFNPALLNMMKLITRLPLNFPYWHNLSGGTALQVCIRQGWIKYLILVFEKRYQ